MTTERRIDVEAGARLDAKADARARTHDHLATRTVRLLDPAITSLRARRLVDTPLDARMFDQDVVAEIRRQPDVCQLSDKAQLQLERVIGQPDFLPVWFLQRGAELRRTVGKVLAKAPNGTTKEGTGFLVGPGLLLTNAHVLDWSDLGQAPLADIAPRSAVLFDLEERFDGTFAPAVTFDLDPATLLLHSPWNDLDFVLVAVKARSKDGAASIDDYGYNRLTAELGKIAAGEPVFIIQHPHGQPKQVVLNENRLIARNEAEQFLYYEADTDHGSSGSPVYNRQWEVVALHHASRRIGNGPTANLPLRDDPSQPDVPARQPVLNEGVRVSRILGHLATLLQPIEAGQPPSAPALVSVDGMARLRAMLATRVQAPPVQLINPIPVAQDLPLPAARHTARFANPD